MPSRHDRGGLDPTIADSPTCNCFDAHQRMDAGHGVLIFAMNIRPEWDPC